MLRAGELDSTMQIEQVSAAQGRATTSGVSLDITGQSVQNSGAQAGNSASEIDPVSTAAVYSQTAVSQGSPSTLSATNGYFSLVLTPSPTETGNSISTSSAVILDDLLPDPLGVNQNDLLPCGSGSLQTADVGHLQRRRGRDPHGQRVVAGSIAAVPSAAKSFTNLDTAAGASSCTQATGDGCMWTRSALDRHGHPGQPPRQPGIASPRWTLPAGPNGYLLRASSFSDIVSAESGVGSAAPAATMPTGAGAPTISYWNGAGYSSMTIAVGGGRRRAGRERQHQRVNLHKFCSMLPSFVFEVHPVVTVEDAVRGELEVIAWRDGLKGRKSLN